MHNLQLADPAVHEDKSVDILLGVAEYCNLTLNGLIKGQIGELIAQNSELGWLIMGPTEENENIKKRSITSLITNMEIEEKLSKFFEYEGVKEEENDCVEKMTEEEQFCEKRYVENTKRNDDGRFIVKMPFVNNAEPSLGNSKKAALATLFQLEKRFDKQPELKKMYTEAIHDAIEKGHMIHVNDPPSDAHYLPHHAVFKDSTTTKLRMV